MRKFDFSKDIISFVSVLITFTALIFSISSPEIFNKYFVPLIIVLFLVLFMYIISYFKASMQDHEREINKINEKINIYKDISDLKAKVELLPNRIKMGKRGQSIPIDVIIRIIQIGAVVFAIYIILKVFGVNF